MQEYRCITRLVAHVGLMEVGGRAFTGMLFNQVLKNHAIL